MVSAVTFSEGEEAYFRNRFVRTRRFKEEEKKVRGLLEILEPIRIFKRCFARASCFPPKYP